MPRTSDGNLYDASGAIINPAIEEKQSLDFFLEVSKGNIPGHELLFYQAGNQGVGTIAQEMSFWNVASIYQYLSADTTLFASSSSASDTAVTLALFGLDDTYTEVTRTVTLNGQTQVALSGLMFRLRRCIVTGGTAPLGDVYIAETDTLTAGVPDTISKIQMKMAIGTNIGNNSTVTVPDGKTFFIVSQVTRSGKEEALRIKVRTRPENGVFAEAIDFEVFEVQNGVFNIFPAVESRSDIDLLITPEITNVRSIFAFSIVVVDNDLMGTASLL